MSILSLRFSPLNLYSKTLKPQVADPPPRHRISPPSRLHFRMKDPPPSYGALYVPPHHRRGSANTAATASATTDSKPVNVTAQGDAFSSARVNRNGNSDAAKAYPYLPPHHYQKQFQQQKENSGREEVAEQVCDRQMEFSAQPNAASSENIDAWQWKLNALLRDNDKQEVISREKKDRRDFEQIAALASRMGLHSQLYTKVVVVSKFPLPHYRFDLDDKRPQREVIVAPGLQKRVDAYLVDYISNKRKSMDVMSRSSSNASIATDEGLFEQPEPLPHSKTAMEKIFWRRSVQMHDKQRNWQVQLPSEINSMICF